MTNLLATKIHLPTTRTDIVPRPHLLTLLDGGLQVKLTLVSAPAGFGKSTLIANWLASRSYRAAWLSLDESDNDPIRFWSYVIAALQTFDANCGSEALEILNTAHMNSIEPVIISLINDLAQKANDIIFILDDIHTINTSAIYESLQFLLDHQPPTLHIILLTRADPLLSVARLRARRQLVEIRAAELQFSSDEATMLFNTLMGLDLTPAQIDALALRTEGWITGLQLAGLSLQEQADPALFIQQFTGSHQFILDYLTEEVLRTLPEGHHHFLMQTAVLDRMCADLCRAVTQNADSHTIFADIRGKNLFLIALDASGQWFRYHHLFAEILLARLKREAFDSSAALHLRAAAWYEAQGYIEEAVAHTLRSGDMIQAKQLIVRYWAAMVYQGHVATALDWLDRLPDEISRADPAVLLAHCWALHLNGQTPAIAPYLEQTEHFLNELTTQDSFPPEQLAMIAAQIDMLRSSLARSCGDPASALAYAEHAVQIVPPAILDASGPAWNLLGVARMHCWDINGAIRAFEQGIELAYNGGNYLSAFVSTFGLSVYLIMQGRLLDATEVCQSALERVTYDNQADIPASGLLYIALSRIAWERNALDEASTLINKGRRIARPGGFSEAMRYGRYASAQIAAARGDIAAANQIFKKAKPIIRAMSDPYLTGELHREWATALLLAGDIKSAQQSIHILREKCAVVQNPSLQVASAWMDARLLIEEKKYDQVSDTLEPIIRRVRDANSQGELLRLLALQAVALSHCNRQPDAEEILLKALQLGAPQGFTRRWCDAGPEINPLLKALQGDNRLNQEEQNYREAILATCQIAASGQTAQSPNENLLSPLSNRELELLKLIDSGYTNRQIADELVITLHTVKKHTSNIYSKLGVASRTQAIVEARKYDLL